MIIDESGSKKARSRRSRSAASNQPSIADMFAKKYVTYVALPVFCTRHLLLCIVQLQY